LLFKEFAAIYNGGDKCDLIICGELVIAAANGKCNYHHSIQIFPVDYAWPGELEYETMISFTLRRLSGVCLLKLQIAESRSQKAGQVLEIMFEI
jgi:hypothetical protein